MDSFWGNVKSPGWWIGIVVVGLVLNWFAAYLTRGTDWVGRRLSRRWAERSAVHSAARKRQIEQLRANPHEQIMLGLDALDDKIHGISYVGLAFVVGMTFARSRVVWLSWIVVLILSFGAYLMGTGGAKQLLLKEVRSLWRNNT